MHLERTIEFFRPVVYSTLFSLDVMLPFFQTSCALSISRVLGQRGGTKSSEIGEGCRIFWISTVFSRISLKRQRSFSCASRFSARGASSMQGFGSATTRSCYRSLLSVLPSLSPFLSSSVAFLVCLANIWTQLIRAYGRLLCSIRIRSSATLKARLITADFILSFSSFPPLCLFVSTRAASAKNERCSTKFLFFSLFFFFFFFLFFLRRKFLVATRVDSNSRWKVVVVLRSIAGDQKHLRTLSYSRVTSFIRENFSINYRKSIKFDHLLEWLFQRSRVNWLISNEMKISGFRIRRSSWTLEKCASFNDRFN